MIAFQDYKIIFYVYDEQQKMNTVYDGFLIFTESIKIHTSL